MSKKISSNEFIKVELENLFKKHGRLTGRIVVAAAKAAFKAGGEKNGLARFFTWDAKKALEKNLLEEAGYLIRRVNLQDARFPQSVRAWVSLKTVPVSENENEPERAENVYVPILNALSSKQMREQLLARALGEAELWADRYNNLAELVKIVKAVRVTKLEVLKK